METSEVTLIAKYKQGEYDAFGELYDRYITKIYRFIYYKVLHKETAEDIASDVFYKALANIASYDTAKGPFAAWLYRIARNAVIDHYRTTKATTDIEDIFDLGVDERTAERIDARATIELVSKYLETLSSKQREIVMLRVWGEMRYREIAEIVGGSEDSVKMTFSRAIRDIREKFGPLAAFLLLFANP